MCTEMVLASPSAMIGVHLVRNSRIRPDLQNIDTNSIRLRVALAGQGPLVILIHGFPESWYSWRHQIPALADAGYRVAAPDLRGYGGSDKPLAIEAYSIKDMCADIGSLIAALGAERAIAGKDFDIARIQRWRLGDVNWRRIDDAPAYTVAIFCNPGPSGGTHA